MQKRFNFKHLLLIIMIVLILPLSGCTKKAFNNVDLGKSKYHITGLYLNYIDSNYSQLDDNPKIFIVHSTNETLNAEHCMTHPETYFKNLQKNITESEGIRKYNCSATLYINTKIKSRIEIYYMIEYPNGAIDVSKKSSNIIDLNKMVRYDFKVSYQLNDKKYALNITIDFIVV